LYIEAKKIAGNEYPGAPFGRHEGEIFTVDGADDSRVNDVERALDDGNVNIWLTYN
jgi:hypothetical protein